MINSFEIDEISTSQSGKLSFTETESSVKYMKKSYRISTIGKKGPQYPTCWEMPVKSWITRPTDETGTVKAGK